MSYASDMKRFVTKCETNIAAIHVGSALLAKRSVQYGSPITGAPGQPVESGDLLESIQIEALGPFVSRIFTTLPYADSNEDGIARPNGGPYRLRSSRGGRWSFKLTRIGFPRIVAYVAQQLKQGRESV